MAREFTVGRKVTIRRGAYVACWEIGGLARHFAKHPQGEMCREHWRVIFGRQPTQQEYEARSYEVIESASLKYRSRDPDHSPEWLDHFVDIDLIESRVTDHRKARKPKGSGDPKVVVRSCMHAHSKPVPAKGRAVPEFEAVASLRSADGEQERALRDYWLNRGFNADRNGVELGPLDEE